MYLLILTPGLIQYTWDGPFYISRSHRLYFPNKIVFLSLKINFVLANRVDPNSFHQSLLCLAKYPVNKALKSNKSQTLPVWLLL